MLIDTHAHIYLKDFEDDIEQVIERAKNVGIRQILLPNIDISSIDSLKRLTSLYPTMCLPMMGLHPCSVKDDFREVLDVMKAELDSGQYIAIGETGCDMYWDKTHRNEQMEAFAEQARWAKEKNLPLVIHARDAFDEIFEVLDSENSPALRGVFHCFTGNEAQAEKIMSYGGFMMGIGGVLTYKNSGLGEVLATIELKNLILETDAPYLSPVPHRGKRNEPAFVIEVVQKLADIKQTTTEEIARVTTLNAKRLFGLQMPNS